MRNASVTGVVGGEFGNAPKEVPWEKRSGRVALRVNESHQRDCTRGNCDLCDLLDALIAAQMHNVDNGENGREEDKPVSGRFSVPIRLERCLRCGCAHLPLAEE